jgi:flagellar M-ring protein FliF
VNPRVAAGVDRARGFMTGFTTGQKAVVVVAILLLALGTVALTRWVTQPTLVPLYGSLTGEDANAIVEELTAEGVRYELADGGTTVLVPQEQVYDLRVSLSGQGLPANAGDGAGYEILDQQGITATDFQQNVAFRRALEGELNRTLMAIEGVRTAVVHLALPEKDVFSTEEDKPTASVLLALQPGVTLETDQIDSVTRLVAGSVENLAPADVTVTDSTGKLLSSGGTGGGASASAANQTDEQTAKFENRVSTAAQQVLDQVLGPNRSVVRVSAELNFDAKDTTSETYVVPGENTPPLSESTTTEQYSGNGAAAGGALGETLPRLQPNTGENSGGSYAKEQRTVNNSVGKVVDRIQSAPGGVRRMTIAVVLDSKTTGALNPAQVQALVGNAVGFNAQRGDLVQVESIPFDTSAAEAAQQEIAAAEQAQKTQGYIDMAKKAGLWLLGLLVVFFLLKRRKKADDETTVEATASNLPGAAEGLVLPAGVGPGAIEGGGLLPALPGGAGGTAVLDRDRIRDEVSALVESQPDDVAAMLQGWLDEQRS